MTAWLEIIPAISKLLDKIIPDPVAREQAKLELVRAERAQDLEELKLAIAADQLQAEINKIEAGSSNLFVSGWRPFIGWVCGVAFAYHFILQPFLAFIISNSGRQVSLPLFDMQTLYAVVMGLLGLGSLRTFEKIYSVAK